MLADAAGAFHRYASPTAAQSTKHHANLILTPGSKLWGAHTTMRIGIVYPHPNGSSHGLLMRSSWAGLPHWSVVALFPRKMAFLSSRNGDAGD